MKYIVNSACPLDCPDRCSLQVEVEDGQATKISGASSHPITRGFACSKAQLQLSRLASPDRVTRPLLKQNGAWRPITWDEAYTVIVEKLTDILNQFGPQAILHLSGSGSEGLLQNFDKRFFNALGGVTKASGCICWGSGYQAQEYDFGGVRCHSWGDVVNAQTIILWGRDPMVTNQHLVPFIKSAKEKGAKVIVINPLRIASAKLADVHIAPKPGTDGALAMAIAHVLMERRALDFAFIHQHIHGFAEYAQRVKECTPQWAEGVTGVSAREIEQVAMIYANSMPSAIFLGYGLQRYANGGQTIRAINALAAITGNLGIPGGGVNYAHQYWKQIIASLAGKEFAQKNRHFPYAKMGSAILQASEPPIKALFVSKLNPATQLPNSHLVKTAFKSIDFKVVLDFFMNDTAQEADLFLPVATSFEQSDIVLNSWNEYAVYSETVIPPRGQAKTELEIFATLAEKMGIGEIFGHKSPEEWLQQAIAPLAQFGITLESFKAGPVRCPNFPEVAWSDYQFTTPSGKYELYSQQALEEMGDPLPGFGALGPLGAEHLVTDYPLHLLTPHTKYSLNSSLYTTGINLDLPNYPEVQLHPEDARARYLALGDRVIIETTEGELCAVVVVSADVQPGIAVLPQGSWIKDDGGVNRLTSEVQADIGGGTAYYDCRCQVRKYHLDSLSE